MAAKLTTQAVQDVLLECLSDGSESVKVQGIIRHFSFSKVKLAEHADEIFALLLELPDDFMSSKGGGTSFLLACHDKHGNHWGEHPDMEALFCLGIAIDKVSFPMFRELWKLMPGGMPYLFVKDSDEDSQQDSRLL